LLERALTITQSLYGPDHPLTVARQNNLAATLRDVGQLDRAKTLLEKALAFYDRSFMESPLDAGIVMNNLANVYRAMGRAADARQSYERALAMLERSVGADHPFTVHTRENLASLERSGGAIGSPSDA
jgi:tetratricopeptide (TPR) repeat protein